MVDLARRLLCGNSVFSGGNKPMTDIEPGKEYLEMVITPALIERVRGLERRFYGEAIAIEMIGKKVEDLPHWLYREVFMPFHPGMSIDSLGGEHWFNARGQRHRTDGPAIRRRDGSEMFWVNGKRLTRREFAKFKKEQKDD